jgi:hypothetical protein
MLLMIVLWNGLAVANITPPLNYGKAAVSLQTRWNLNSSELPGKGRYQAYYYYNVMITPSGWGTPIEFAKDESNTVYVIRNINDGSIAFD